MKWHDAWVLFWNTSANKWKLEKGCMVQMWWNLNYCRWVVGCVDAYAEVELQERCFLGVIPVKDKGWGAGLVREGLWAITHIWYLWENQQEADGRRRASAWDVIWQWQPTKCVSSFKRPAQWVSLFKASAQWKWPGPQPLLCSLPGWRLPRRERSRHGGCGKSPKCYIWRLS